MRRNSSTAMIDDSPFLKFLTPVVMLIVYLTKNGSRRFRERTNFRWFVLEGAVIWVGVVSPQGEFLGTYGKAHPVSYVGKTSLTHRDIMRTELLARQPSSSLVHKSDHHD